MNNCLVTKLKASVNNSNLPIFEKMQQFTLDAIIVSGNSSMTEDQKWALNHLFYALGAIDNPTLWNKIKILHMPLIALNVDHSCINFVDNTDMIMSTNKSKMMLQGGGIISTEIINYIQKDMSIPIDNANFTCITGYSGISKTFYGWSLVNSVGDIVYNVYNNNTSAGLSFGTNNTSLYKNKINARLFGMSFNGQNTDDMFGYHFVDDVLTKVPILKIDDRYIHIQQSSTQLKIRANTEEKIEVLNFLLISEGLTDSEMKKIISAIKNVIDNFLG